MLTARNTGSGVVAAFDDGTEATGDILIGADGIHSRVRTIIDPNAPAPRYVPVLNNGGYIPDFTVDVPAEEFRMQFGTRCFFAWMPTPDGGTVWFANPPLADEPAYGVLSGMSDEGWRAWLHTLMDGDVGPAPEIIDAAPEPMFGWATYDLPVVRRWHRARMLIIGDAAHATAPSAGQGASMALEDAVVLARELAAHGTAGLARYEQARRARVEKIVANGARSSSSKIPGPAGRRVRETVLRAVFHTVVTEKSTAWITGHRFEREPSPARPTP
jgi:FAD-dependent urate hydroxylase